MTFLIFYSRRIGALEQAVIMRNNAERVGLAPEDIVVPSGVVIQRHGRERKKVKKEVPLLGPMIFVRWNGIIEHAHRIERLTPFISIMRLPHGGYAACRDKELAKVCEPVQQLPPPDPRIRRGSIVAIKKNEVPFLEGAEGTVIKVKTNGEVLLTLHVPSQGRHRYLKISTLQIHGSLLTIKTAAI